MLQFKLFVAGVLFAGFCDAKGPKPANFYKYDVVKDDQDEDPLVTMNATQIIEYNGYPAEYHQIWTEDGYVLGLQRIPYGRGEKPAPGETIRPAVLLQHGLLGCATNWITNLPDQSLAYILADAGYDVWLGNMRGSTYSTIKGKYDPTENRGQYWKFSFDEMAQYDLPAMINYITDTTGNAQIHYVGHSQGTLIGFAHFSQNATTSAKVKSFYALGPVTTVTYITSVMRDLAQFTYPIDYFFELFGYNDFLPSDDMFHKWEEEICDNDPSITTYCDNLMFLLLGSETTNLNVSRIPIYVGHNPAGTSSQNFAHFGQMVKAQKMQYWSYGWVQNLIHYHSIDPPEYHPENLMVKTAFFWGGQDNLADPTDVEDYLNNIVNVDLIIDTVYVPQYAHLDFIWAVDANKYVYSKILELMKTN